MTRTRPVVPPVQTEEYNTSGLTLEQVRALPLLGRYRNEWRQRLVEVYRLAPGELVSVGTTFDDSVRVICKEPDDAHKYALMAWQNGNYNYVAR